MQAGCALDRNLVLLLVIAAHTLARSGRSMPAGVLGSLASDVLEVFPVGLAPLGYGRALARLARIVSPPTCTTGDQ